MVKPGRVLFEIASKNKSLLKDSLQFSLRKFPMGVQVIDRGFKLS
jgi:ribosomal protein L16/L10AE